MPMIMNNTIIFHLTYDIWMFMVMLSDNEKQLCFTLYDEYDICDFPSVMFYYFSVSFLYSYTTLTPIIRFYIYLCGILFLNVTDGAI